MTDWIKQNKIEEEYFRTVVPLLTVRNKLEEEKEHLRGHFPFFQLEIGAADSWLHP